MADAMNTASDSAGLVGMIKGALPLKYQLYNWPRLVAGIIIPATLGAFLAIFLVMYTDCKVNLVEKMTAAPLLLLDSLSMVGGSNPCIVNIGKFYYPSEGTAAVTGSPTATNDIGLFFQQCNLNQPIADAMVTMGVKQCPEPAQVMSAAGVTMPDGTVAMPPGFLWRDALTMNQAYAAAADTANCFLFSDTELGFGDKVMPDYATTGFPLLYMTVKFDVCPDFLPTFGAALGYVGAIEGILILLIVTILKAAPLDPKLRKNTVAVDTPGASKSNKESTVHA